MGPRTLSGRTRASGHAVLLGGKARGRQTHVIGLWLQPVGAAPSRGNVRRGVRAHLRSRRWLRRGVGARTAAQSGSAAAASVGGDRSVPPRRGTRGQASRRVGVVGPHVGAPFRLGRSSGCQRSRPLLETPGGRGRTESGRHPAWSRGAPALPPLVEAWRRGAESRRTRVPAAGRGAGVGRTVARGRCGAARAASRSKPVESGMRGAVSPRGRGRRRGAGAAPAVLGAGPQVGAAFAIADRGVTAVRSGAEGWSQGRPHHPRGRAAGRGAAGRLVAAASQRHAARAAGLCCSRLGTRLGFRQAEVVAWGAVVCRGSWR